MTGIKQALFDVDWYDDSIAVFDDFRVQFEHPAPLLKPNFGPAKNFGQKNEIQNLKPDILVFIGLIDCEWVQFKVGLPKKCDYFLI